MTRPAWIQAATMRWKALQQRERRAVQWAALVLGLFLLWTVALAPALKTLHQADAQGRLLEAHLQRMQAWQGQVQVLRQQAKPAAMSAAQRRDGLVKSLAALGEAEISWAANTASVKIKGATPQALGAWLADLGPQWRATPSQASLSLDDRGLWQGQITLQVP